MGEQSFTSLTVDLQSRTRSVLNEVNDEALDDVVKNTVNKVEYMY